ncbi:MAG: adenylate/guanylate cyclase domain-containing protein, partial [Candidatus Anammoxibacter sp.]
MKKIISCLFLVLVICVFLETCQASFLDKKSPKAVEGVIDLSDWDFVNNGVVNLDGEWEWYNGILLEPDDFERIDIANEFSIADKREFVKLPSGLWKVNETLNGKVYGNKISTIRLKIKFNINEGETYGMKSLYFMLADRLWIDGELFNSNDKSVRNQKTISYHHTSQIAQFYPVNPTTDIILQISDSFFNRIGFDRSIEIGLKDQIVQGSNNKFVLSLIFCVCFLLMALYQFRISGKGVLSVYFGTICITPIFLFMAPTERFFIMLFTGFNWEIANKIEYASATLGFTALGLFVMKLYPRESVRIVTWVSQGLGVLFTALIFVPIDLINRYTIMTIWCVIVSYCAYLIYILIRAVCNKRGGSIWILSTFLFVTGVIINDILHEGGFINTGQVAQYGYFVFIILLSFPLAQRSLDTLKRLQAYERFVPTEFLKNLDKVDIVDVKLGDNAEKNMSVLFSDIRNFTSLSENMTPEENFKFINSYLSQMGPVIKRHHGFIDKFIGDAIMALFDTSADEAVKGAIGMIEQLDLYNKGRRKAGYKDLQIGVGINTGALMIGTVGEHHRMEVTVISDAVNLASRVEGMTKVYGVSILISDDTFHGLKDPSKYHIREIDQVKVKGRVKPVTLWEVFDNDLPEIFDYKLAISSIFKEARTLYQSKKFDEAKELFLDCLARYPQDKTALLYIDRCKLYKRMEAD